LGEFYAGGDEVDLVKQTLKQVIEPRRGGQVTAGYVADRMGIATSTLYDYTNGRDLPARLVAAVTMSSGDTALIEALCEACGGVFVPAPRGESLELGTVRRCVHEFAQAMDAACDALEDGSITDRECARVEREGLEAITAVYRLIEEFKARAVQGRTGRVVRLADTAKRGQVHR